MNRQVPVNTPLITEEDINSVVEALRDGWVSGEGPVVNAFEESFAASCNRKHAIAVTNGTAAIELVIHALEFGPGDEVILPSFAIISCVSQILRTGATPIFVDSTPDTWNMDVTTIEALITPRTKAIMAVHTYGLPVDMKPLIAISQKFSIPIIEDAAESHGLIYDDKPCGSFGLVSTFSFYANKHITTGEGGMVVTNNDELVNTGILRSNHNADLCTKNWDGIFVCHRFNVHSGHRNFGDCKRFSNHAVNLVKDTRQPSQISQTYNYQYKNFLTPKMTIGFLAWSFKENEQASQR